MTDYTDLLVVRPLDAPYLDRVVNPAADMIITTAPTSFQSILSTPMSNNGSEPAAISVDWSSGAHQRFTLTGNAAITFSALPRPATGLMLYLEQDAVGGRVPTWGAGISFRNGTAPGLSAGADALDVLAFVFDGTNYHGNMFASSSAVT